MPVAWPREPGKHGFKAAFFDRIARVAGGGRALSPLALSWRGFPETARRADEALARAKKRPGNPVATALKRAFLRGRYNHARHWFMAHPDHTALIWQGLTGARRAFALGARDAGAGTLFAELSPLPGMLTLDPTGVNAGSGVPRDPDFYTEMDPDPTLLNDLKLRLTARAPRRADVGQGDAALPRTPFLFVPLQVPDDSQMILFSGWVGGAEGFIDALADASHALPDGWHLRLKEHPSARVPLTDRIDAAIAAGARMVRDNTTDSFAQLAASRGVVTVNSSMGLQAMFWDKPVIATGQGFWTFPPLCSCPDGPGALRAAFASLPGFDAGLRTRFLTWLATRYFIPDTGGEDRIARRLGGEI